MRLFATLLMVLSFSFINSQTIDFQNDKGFGSLFIKLYGEAFYNQPFKEGFRQNGNLDVQRMVTLFGYQFSKDIQFVTEIELEHVSEVFVEQAFLKMKLSKFANLRVGMLLTPMGIVNTDHEPTNFHSVLRPTIDNVLVPTTWRELGIGIAGLNTDLSLKYEAYIMNGFLSYGSSAKLGGSKPFRSGRQKGIQSTISGLPSLATRVEYFGFNNLKLGLSTYIGETNSALYDGLSVEDQTGIARADSSVVTIYMMGFHTTYNLDNFEFTGQFIYSNNTNTEAYNKFTGRDLGKQMYGYFAEVAYNVLPKEKSSRLLPFLRLSQMNTHLGVDQDTEKNPGYNRNIYTVGMHYEPIAGVALKTDYQWFTSDNSSNNSSQFNMGVGVWF